LVVITIIIILIGLLTPVVIIALNRAKESRIQTEINMLDSAFKAYKEKHGSYPPSDFLHITNMNSPQYIALANHLAKAFPRCNVGTEIQAIITAAGGNSAPDPPINPAQAVTFWLSGFCTDPEQPISGLLKNPPLQREAPLIDFDKTRLYPTSLALKCYAPVDTPGVPYVYFAAQSYYYFTGSGKYVVASFNVGATGNGGTGYVHPYAIDQQAPPAGTPPTFVNASSFQIIHAGLDSDFGGGGTSNASPTNTSVAYFPSGTNYNNGDKDNIVNFSGGKNLGDSIPQ
jgi:type II secretory pathway pseudopilin PulG